MINFRPSPEFEKLNDAQRQSLDWTRSLSIRANAGSGKTSVLIQRIVQILHHDWNTDKTLKLDHIVAITFTRKAAAEMKLRLRKALVACLEQSSGDERAYWQQRLDELPTCPIGTIDSLCHRLLGAAIHEGMIDDLDPSFGVLQGLDRDELLDRAIERTEQQRDATEELKTAWDNWLTTQGRYGLASAIRRLLNSPVSAEREATALDFVASSGVDAIYEGLNLPNFAETLKYFKQNWKACCQKVESVIRDLKRVVREGDKTKSVAAKIESLEGFLATNKSYHIGVIAAIREALLTKGGTPPVQGFFAGGSHKSPVMEEVVSEWIDLLQPWEFVDAGDGDPGMIRQLLVIHRAAQMHFRVLCRQENRYDFNYLAERVTEVLCKPANAERLTSHYRHVMIDEFQDTNDLHWNIVARVAGEDPSSPVGSSKLMVVGDPQQSIYRFRQADPTVFERIIGLIRAGNKSRAKSPTSYDQHSAARGVASSASPDERLGEMRLARNYRTQPRLLRLIDHLSRHAFGDDSAYQELKAGLKAEAVHVELRYLVPPADNKDNSVDPASEDSDTAESEDLVIDNTQIELVASELRRLRVEKKFQWKQMAILMRSRSKHLTDLERILRERSIPYQLLGGLGFWQRQEVRDLVSLIHCLANPSDELAMFAVLRGPLIGLDDSELLFLSTLGGRDLQKGLRRAARLFDESVPWETWAFDEQLQKSLQQAYVKISSDRQALLKTAIDRLGEHGQWRERVDRLPPSELLRLALEESGAWGIYAKSDEGGEQALANLRLLLEHIRGLDADRPGPLANLARRLRRVVDEATKEEQAEFDPPEGNAVQIMTVHKAKGLEFPVVALVGLEKPMPTSHSDLWLLDRFQHLKPEFRESEQARQLHGLPVLRYVDPAMPLATIQPLLHQAIGRIERGLDRAESARVFYVAITRAQQVLLLAGKSKSPSNSWQAWVNGAFGLANDPPAGTYLVNSDPELSIEIVRAESTVATVENADQPSKVELDLQPLFETPRTRSIGATSLQTMLQMWEKQPDQWKIRYGHGVQLGLGPIAAVLSDKADDDQENGKRVGTLVHRALELGDAYPKKADEAKRWLLAQAAALVNHFDRLDEAPVEEESASASALALANAAESILKKILPKNPFRGLLEADGEAEVDFQLTIGTWIITGRFDRLIRVDGRYEIVDWKTDSDPPKVITNNYLDQMKTYALSLMRSLPETSRPAEIVVHLAMTKHDRSERLVFPASELDAHEADLLKRLPAVST